jgi:hypothetical protein
MSQRRKLRRALPVVAPVPPRLRVPWPFSEAPTPEASHPNTPTAIGYELGAQIARLVDVEEAKQRALFPRLQPRCVDCAARAGTVPNGCEETLMDFLKCALEGTEFLCHKGVPDGETPTNVCRGWLSLQMSSSQDPQRSVAQAVFGDFFERLPK